MTEKTAAKPKAAKTPAEKHGCACGCGEQVERTFKQGHDQRLISLMASDLVYADVWKGTCNGILKGADVRADIQDRMDKVAERISKGISEALSAKFVRAAHRAWELEKGKTERDEAKAARRAAAKTASATKTKRTKKATTSSEEAGVVASPAAQVASEVKNSRVGKSVVATASNADVDALDQEPTEPTYTSGQKVKIRAGKRTRTATVRGMNQAGKVTAVAVLTNGVEKVLTEGQFEITN
jgi:hypothetical protein